jgi:hypothetical protein
MFQKLPIGISSFSKLRRDGCVYVDKTEIAYTLITRGYRFFLARPRRFGKSLFVSTLREILEGNKELFEGLWIANSDYQWQPHGVIALDISALGIDSVEKFTTNLTEALQEVANYYKLAVQLPPNSPELGLRRLVHALHERFGRVVILIDEYDSPILHALKTPELAEAMRDRVRLFFAAIKGLDSYVHFVFITGVSSFSRAGLFSGMNNLHTISLIDRYATVCGYTDEEVDHYFADHITQWAKKTGMSYDELRQQIREWYNGYHFSAHASSVYNPFSLISAFENAGFKNYWFQSGLPSFLVEILKKEYMTFDPDQLEATESLLEGMFEPNVIPLMALMFQSGYLTICGYEPEIQLYKLAFPNQEVRVAFQKYLLDVFAQLDFISADRLSLQLRNALNQCSVENIVNTIKQLFAHVPYQLHVPEEKFYHALLQMVFTASGIKAQSEYSTSHGRIDLVLDMQHYIYVIEVKFKESAEAALAQIEERRYYERFVYLGKKIILLGLSFKREPSNFNVTCVIRELS